MKTFAKYLSLVVLLGISTVGCDQVVGKLQAPVVVSTRDSSVPGGGEVAVFSNQSSARVTVNVEFNHYPSRKFKTVIDLGPNEVKEIGWMEGWKVTSGDAITVTDQGYMDKIWHAL